ncbi:Bifunctional pantoate ligase/cytidylate kinase [Halomicronema hongdechloris C2206]|uniref:Bifunctional pantoate ligase/cytidylate kinase n=1 Tax=Halomicronema hongdechloris C2206 TaxID=1641165 RepID=A0A1Z3HND5_9CYAN|nr:bifunctional pantoate--beta-alanine ligase/(d)CMP kinase [Halomicronema hongdechloris]ASC71799.1 Bifunctional pantoate ligase/cytidylate kinase [Halomicronema hongdechloris C2206]
MQLLKTVEGLHCYLVRLRAAPAAQTVGLVPTMGALHQGHASLIQRARQDNDQVVVSIFVNPLQFGPGEDLDQYPRTLSEDLRQCHDLGVDAVFAPTAAVLYGDSLEAGVTQVVPPPAMTACLCGRFRPGHFTGVATVVTKLLNLVQPDRAYFGQKDAQQLAILQQLVRDLNIASQIVPCPTVREADGLAVSSRNRYLSPQERQQATVLYQGLQAAAQRFQQGECQGQVLIDTVQAVLATVPAVRPQYVELVHPQTLTPLWQIDTVGLLAVAAHVGQTRLIDNWWLRSRRPIIAIDGPAGAGKSTVARRVAQTLDLLYLDSGAMYRAITWLVLQRGIDPQDEVAVAEVIPDCEIRLAAGEPGTPFPSRIWINDQEVTRAIRSPAVTQHVSTVAAQPMVRQRLLQQQQVHGVHGGIVMEGRDIGTQVFPQAELKIFLTASVQERARRRQRDLAAQQHPPVSLEDLAQAIDERDRKDSTRRVAPLQQADDAIELCTDGLTIDDVVAKIVHLYHQSLNAAATTAD